MNNEWVQIVHILEFVYAVFIATVKWWITCLKSQDNILVTQIQKSIFPADDDGKHLK